MNEFFRVAIISALAETDDSAVLSLIYSILMNAIETPEANS